MEMDQVTLTQVMKFVVMLASANPTKLDKVTTRKIARSIFTVTAIARDAKMTSEMFADCDRFADTKLLPMMNSLVDLFEKHIPIPKPAFPTIGPMSMPPSCNDLAVILPAGKVAQALGPFGVKMNHSSGGPAKSSKKART